MDETGYTFQSNTDLLSSLNANFPEDLLPQSKRTKKNPLHKALVPSLGQKMTSQHSAFLPQAR